LLIHNKSELFGDKIKSISDTQHKLWKAMYVEGIIDPRPKKTWLGGVRKDCDLLSMTVAEMAENLPKTYRTGGDA